MVLHAQHETAWLFKTLQFVGEVVVLFELLGDGPRRDPVPAAPVLVVPVRVRFARACTHFVFIVEGYFPGLPLEYLRSPVVMLVNRSQEVAAMQALTEVTAAPVSTHAPLSPDQNQNQVGE
jgi:hypothetical protein